MALPSAITWHKSSYSNGMGGECVEVAAMATRTAVRDSKDAQRPALVFRTDVWSAFVTAMAQRKA
ncbi:DUF397 domain-containing protein [Streptomyces sp. NPDC058572]|uniref:DUF397 domain-containing protein n=1 Tax=Streptomyces sp. NPDC058572 TaxID=3346546 RepID=UPI0036516360